MNCSVTLFRTEPGRRSSAGVVRLRSFDPAIGVGIEGGRSMPTAVELTATTPTMRLCSQIFKAKSYTIHNSF